MQEVRFHNNETSCCEQISLSNARHSALAEATLARISGNKDEDMSIFDSMCLYMYVTVRVRMRCKPPWRHTASKDHRDWQKTAIHSTIAPRYGPIWQSGCCQLIEKQWADPD